MLIRTASRMTQTAILAVSIFVLIMAVQVVAAQNGPQEISPDVTCGKCGMYPAKYPKWQAQIVFKDGSMTPFDGCKCLFGFKFNMEKFDKKHTPADIAGIWVRDFNTGDWLDAQTAHYVVGSSMMGPMGKELIPFADAAAAESFQKEHGGDLAGFDAITMATLKPLMGMMHHKGMKGMKMNGNGHGAMSMDKMEMNGHMMNN